MDKALGPNTDFAGSHSLQFYHQVQQWEGNLLDTLSWGLVIRGGNVLQITIWKEPAPHHILKIINAGAIVAVKSLPTAPAKSMAYHAGRCATCATVQIVSTALNHR